MTLLSLTVIGWLFGTAVLSWALPKRLQPAGIVLCTAAFLAYYSPISLGILTAASVAVYALARRGRVRGAVVVCLVGAISAVFIWFKLRRGAIGMTVADLAMPLGLSYYSFRMIHYIFESYKRKLEEHVLSDYLCYLFFLPTLHVGPIHRFPEFLRDLRRRRWDPDALSAGLERILYGYAKIVIVSDYLIAKQFNLLVIGQKASHPYLFTYLESISRWTNLYVQFSGYSDVAIGFGLVMGFRIMENFDFPFLAGNIADYWQRWHISLSGWCRDYVFMPMAAVTRKPGVAVLAAMVVLGLWHEFSGRYLIWGLYNGAAIVLWHLFQPVKRRLPQWKGRWGRLVLRAGATVLTMNFVVTSFTVTSYLYDKVRELF